MNSTFVAKAVSILFFFCVSFSSAISGEEAFAPSFSPSVVEYASVFEEEGMASLPYRQAIIGSELPGEYVVVIFFHGISERGKDNEKQVALAYGPLIRYCIANRIKAVLLFPQCPKRKLWARVAPPTVDLLLEPVPSAPMASAIRLLMEKTTMFTPSGVYAVGVSMGGYGVWDLLARCPYMFSGAVIVCGGGDVNQAQNLKHIPIHVAHGTEDVIVPVARSRSMVKAIWNAGGDRVVYKEMPRGGHEIWNQLFEDPATWEWLFAQQTEPRARY